jgi:hypothetical protein
MLKITRCFSLTALAIAMLASAHAGTYKLTDGHEYTGEPLTIKDDGVKLKLASGSYSPMITWDKFTQEGLQMLLAETRSPKDKALIEPLLVEVKSVAIAPPAEKSVTIKPLEGPTRLEKGSGFVGVFSSPLGLLIFAIVYAATLFAGYEVAVYRDRPVPLVCGLAAVPVLGILSPIVFVLMKRAPARPQEVVVPVDTGVPDNNPLSPDAQVSAAIQEKIAAKAAAEEAVEDPSVPKIPAPVVFKRGDFVFNRRFFETKLAPFCRPVPAEADKDMVVWIKAVRGEFSGRRVVQINADDLHLQTFKANATADEMLPFTEILEVQIRHKDYVA